MVSERKDLCTKPNIEQFFATRGQEIDALGLTIEGFVENGPMVRTLVMTKDGQGKVIDFLVDTSALTNHLSQKEAEELGLKGNSEVDLWFISKSKQALLNLKALVALDWANELPIKRSSETVLGINTLNKFRLVTDRDKSVKLSVTVPEPFKAYKTTPAK